MIYEPVGFHALARLEKISGLEQGARSLRAEAHKYSVDNESAQKHIELARKYEEKSYSLKRESSVKKGFLNS